MNHSCYNFTNIPYNLILLVLTCETTENFIRMLNQAKEYREIYPVNFKPWLYESHI